MEWFFQTCVVLSDSPSFNRTAGLLGTKIFIQLRGMRRVMLMVSLRNRINEGQSRPLGRVLSMMRESKATDPRDKIFGCVTLAHKPPEVDISYDSPCGEVFAAIARSLIEHDNSLHPGLLLLLAAFEARLDGRQRLVGQGGIETVVVLGQLFQRCNPVAAADVGQRQGRRPMRGETVSRRDARARRHSLTRLKANRTTSQG